MGRAPEWAFLTYDEKTEASQMFGALPILHRTNTLCFAERLGEIAQRGKAEKLGDLGHGQVGFYQKVLAFVNAA